MDSKSNVILSVILPAKLFCNSLIICVNSLKNAKDYYHKQNLVSDGIEINIVLREEDMAKAKDYFKGEKNINFFSQGSSLKGASYARNVGIKNSQGKFIAFVDHDCIVKEDWVEKIILGFKRVQLDKKIVCLLGNHWLYQKYSVWLKLYGKYRQDHSVEHFKKEGNIIFTDRLDGRNFAIIREIAKKFNFREDVSAEEDRELGVNLIKNGYKIVFNEEMVVYHEPLKLREVIQRQYSYGIGSATWRKTPDWFNRFYLAHFRRFLKKEIVFKQMLFTMFCNFLYQMGRLRKKV